MKHKFLFPLLLLSAVALLSCSSGDDDDDDKSTNKGGETESTTTTSSSSSSSSSTASVEKAVTIDAGQTYQTIVGFGASDCWCPSYVGKYWTSTRDAISELLFSTEISASGPKGIGLSMWRVNLGGGTEAQGDNSGISDKSRRAESYLTDNLSLDWTNCEGQRYFLQRANYFGCESIVLFSNTPPVQYTRNGLGYSAMGGVSNLKEDCYDDFAAYMADVAEYYVSLGYPVTHISPVNEPQYNWADGGQEGSGWTNNEVATLARELDSALTSRGLSTDILLGEAGDWEYLYRTKSDANRSNVISAFFTQGGSAYVGDLTHVNNLIGAHSYYTDGTWSGMRSVRSSVASAAESAGLELWQTEWSMLGDDYSSSEYVGHDNATTMDIALYMSKVIHNDLTVANVTSWSYWTSMDVARWGHKNRFLLISLTPSGGVQDDNSNIEKEGSYQATPTLWVLGNYSLFVRPGYVRISAVLDESRSFFGSAWISPSGKEIVAVYTNLSEKGVRLNETHSNWSGSVSKITTYTTSATKELAPATVATDGQVTLDAESVTTVVYSVN